MKKNKRIASINYYSVLFKKIAALALLIATSLTVNAQDKAKTVVDHLNQLFVQKSTAIIKDDLSSDFSIAAYTSPSSNEYLKSLTDRYPVDSIIFKNEQTTATAKKINALFYTKGKSKESVIYVNNDYKILYIDLFDQLYGMNRYEVSKLVAKIPFEEENGSIIVSLKLNDYAKPLRFLFDTGADGMAVSKALADSIGLKITRTNRASVVGGNAQISISGDNSVQLNTFVLKNQSIAIFPDMHDKTDGILGNVIAKLYITKVDYDTKEILLYSYGDHQYNDKGISVPVTLPAGVFIIPGEVNIVAGQSHIGNFVFDSGASYNLICFRPFVKNNRLLVSGFKSEYNGTTVSMGMSTPTYSGKAASFSFAHMPKLTNFLITLMAGGGQSENWNPGFDGSIGVRTISRYNFTINMQKKEIHFVPNHTINYPTDFSLGSYLLGFNREGKLKVLSIIASTEQKDLQPEQIINSINGISADALLKDPKKMALINNAASGNVFKINYTVKGIANTLSITKK